MLQRTKLRRYLKALLYHDGIAQSPECDRGFLFVNCDGERPDVHDGPTHQLFENAEGSYQYKKDAVTIAFHVSSESLKLMTRSIDSNDIVFQIDIIANEKNGHKRQNMLDEVQEKILYRILSYQEFTDATTGEKLTSFMRWANELNLTINDETEYDGATTVRKMIFAIKTTECVRITDCDDETLCFDFTNEIGGCSG